MVLVRAFPGVVLNSRSQAELSWPRERSWVTFNHMFTNVQLHTYPPQQHPHHIFRVSSGVICFNISPHPLPSHALSFLFFLLKANFKIQSYPSDTFSLDK